MNVAHRGVFPGEMVEELIYNSVRSARERLNRLFTALSLVWTVAQQRRKKKTV